MSGTYGTIQRKKMQSLRNGPSILISSKKIITSKMHFLWDQ